MAPAVTPCFFVAFSLFSPELPPPLCVCVHVCLAWVRLPASGAPGQSPHLSVIILSTAPWEPWLFHHSSPGFLLFKLFVTYRLCLPCNLISLPTSTTLHWSSPCQVHAYNSASFPCTFCNESLKTCLCVRFCVLKKHRTSHDKVFFFLLVISPSSSITKEQSGLHTCSLYIHEG